MDPTFVKSAYDWLLELFIYGPKQVWRISCFGDFVRMDVLVLALSMRF